MKKRLTSLSPPSSGKRVTGPGEKRWEQRLRELRGEAPLDEESDEGADLRAEEVRSADRELIRELSLARRNCCSYKLLVRVHRSVGNTSSLE